MNKRPEADEYADYYGPYITRVPDGNIEDVLEAQVAEFRNVFAGIDEPTASVLHEPYTWTIKQVMGHMIDVERVFCYRALRWASGDSQSIPGFEQDDWVRDTDWSTPTLAQLTDELELCRRANLCFFRRLAPEAWDRRGAVGGTEMSARAATYILAGHIIHHSEIVAQRVATG